jgi:hypothetical protein
VHDTLSELDFLVFKCSLHCSGIEHLFGRANTFFDTKELPKSNLYWDRLRRQPSRCRRQSSCKKESYGEGHALRARFSGLQVLIPLLWQKRKRDRSHICSANTFFGTIELPQSDLYQDGLRRQPSRCRRQSSCKKESFGEGHALRARVSGLQVLTPLLWQKKDFIFLIAFCMRRESNRDRTLIWVSKYFFLIKKRVAIV